MAPNEAAAANSVNQRSDVMHSRPGPHRRSRAVVKRAQIFRAAAVNPQLAGHVEAGNRTRDYRSSRRVCRVVVGEPETPADVGYQQ